MTDWVYLDHPDLPGGPERFPNDPDAIGAAKARGFVDADDPASATSAVAVKPDEVDDRGQGWVYVQHGDTLSPARVPVEVFGDYKANGYESVAVLEAAAAKKASKKSGPEPPAPVVDDTPKEK